MIWHVAFVPIQKNSFLCKIRKFQVWCRFASWRLLIIMRFVKKYLKFSSINSYSYTLMIPCLFLEHNQQFSSYLFYEIFVLYNLHVFQTMNSHDLSLDLTSLALAWGLYSLVFIGWIIVFFSYRPACHQGMDWNNFDPLSFHPVPHHFQFIHTVFDLPARLMTSPLASAVPVILLQLHLLIQLRSVTR